MEENKNLKYQIIIIANFVVLLFNTFLLLSKKNLANIKNITIFKNIDRLIFKILTNSYVKIEKYLNNKYNISSDLIINYKKVKKKTILLHVVNFIPEQNIKQNLLFYLKNKFIVKFNEYKPDYLIYGVFGNKENNRKYNKCIKIAIYTENTIPDLSNCDYAIGHAHISYLDTVFL